MKTMRPTLIAAGFALMSATGLAMAESAPLVGTTPSTGAPTVGGTGGTGTAQPMSDSFSKLDRNADGMVSKTEARRDAKLAKAFDRVDESKDGNVDMAEFAQFELKEAPPSGLPTR